MATATLGRPISPSFSGVGSSHSLERFADGCSGLLVGWPSQAVRGAGRPGKAILPRLLHPTANRSSRGIRQTAAGRPSAPTVGQAYAFPRVVREGAIPAVGRGAGPYLAACGRMDSQSPTAAASGATLRPSFRMCTAGLAGRRAHARVQRHPPGTQVQLGALHRGRCCAARASGLSCLAGRSVSVPLSPGVSRLTMRAGTTPRAVVPQGEPAHPGRRSREPSAPQVGK
jgi:hypothetical protein